MNWLWSTPREEIQKIYTELEALLADGVITLAVEATYPINEYAAAISHSAASGPNGKEVPSHSRRLRGHLSRVVRRLASGHAPHTTPSLELRSEALGYSHATTERPLHGFGSVPGEILHCAVVQVRMDRLCRCGRSSPRREPALLRAVMAPMVTSGRPA